MNLSYSFFDTSATTATYTLSLHDALPISVHEVLTERRDDDVELDELLDRLRAMLVQGLGAAKSVESSLEPVALAGNRATALRSEEHTSELQSQFHLVCRLLLEKKNVWSVH